MRCERVANLRETTRMMWWHVYCFCITICSNLAGKFGWLITRTFIIIFLSYFFTFIQVFKDEVRKIKISGNYNMHIAYYIIVYTWVIAHLLVLLLYDKHRNSHHLFQCDTKICHSLYNAILFPFFCLNNCNNNNIYFPFFHLLQESGQCRRALLVAEGLDGLSFFLNDTLQLGDLQEQA